MPGLHRSDFMAMVLMTNDLATNALVTNDPTTLDFMTNDLAAKDLMPNVLRDRDLMVNDLMAMPRQGIAATPCAGRQPPRIRSARGGRSSRPTIPRC